MTTKKVILLQKNKTNKTIRMKHKNQTICGKMLFENRHGWKSLHIWGEPFPRGYAHGYLLYKELRDIKKILKFYIKYCIKVKFSEYMRASRTIIKPIIKQKYPELYYEIQGICTGANRRGTRIHIDDIIAWNSLVSLYSYFLEGKDQQQRCSAFIAAGNATKNGDIIMAHNTHSDILTGQLLNIVLKITPTKGHEFVMQTSAGSICSTSDWYLAKSGIVCCETTIGQINYTPTFGVPYFCRIRKAIQYAKSLDDCVKIMETDNAGDYACSWLFGDIITGEIMMFELGLNIKNIKRTKNGVFYGMNSAIGYELRTHETNDNDFNDVNTNSGNRNQRLNFLLNRQYYGKIDNNIAKRIMGDHYDLFLGKSVMNRRGICKHPEIDPNEMYRPYSCTDAKVVDSNMAKKLQFMGIFGSGCGKREFNIKEYVKKHPEYKHWGEVLHDIKKKPWANL